MEGILSDVTLVPSSQNIKVEPEISHLKPFKKRVCLYSLALQVKGYVLLDQDLEGLTGKVTIYLWVYGGWINNERSLFRNTPVSNAATFEGYTPGVCLACKKMAFWSIFLKAVSMALIIYNSIFSIETWFLTCTELPYLGIAIDNWKKKDTVLIKLVDFLM